MTEEQFQEQAISALYGELNQDELRLFNEHLANDSEHRNQFEKLKLTVESANQIALPEPTEIFLKSARKDLREALVAEREGTYKIEKAAKLVTRWFSVFTVESMIPRYAIAVGCFVLFFGGVAIGSIATFIGTFSTSASFKKLERAVQSGDPFSQNDISIQNIRLARSEETGELEFYLDAVTPITIKGKTDDPRVKRILNYAMTNATNVGVRLESINTINETAGMLTDPEIQSSLIKAVKYDKNTGVRKEALATLMKFPFNEQTKSALLYVLSNDENSGLRIDAINMLAEKAKEPKEIDEQVLSALKEKVSDANQYIRLRAAVLLQNIAAKGDKP